MTFYIWSFEHRAWWAPDRCGYTEDIHWAGQYSAADAGEIVTNSILLDEVAILTQIAHRDGPPKFHPYKGDMV